MFFISKIAFPKIVFLVSFVSFSVDFPVSPIIVNV